MSNVDWRSLCREAGLKMHGDTINVPCGKQRSHTVWVDQAQDGVLRVWARVATASQLVLRPGAERTEVEAWMVNRYRELVGFKVDGRGTVIGEAWLPDIELTAEEWALYVQTVAKACDRLEFLWTGEDRQ